MEAKFSDIAWRLIVALKKNGGAMRLKDLARAGGLEGGNGQARANVEMQRPISAGVIVRLSWGVYRLRPAYEHPHLTFLLEKKEGAENE